jgi:hypothetical protein
MVRLGAQEERSIASRLWGTKLPEEPSRHLPSRRLPRREFGRCATHVAQASTIGVVVCPEGGLQSVDEFFRLHSEYAREPPGAAVR